MCCIKREGGGQRVSGVSHNGTEGSDGSVGPRLGDGKAGVLSVETVWVGKSF